jgi:hypothetical protein
VASARSINCGEHDPSARSAGARRPAPHSAEPSVLAASGALDALAAEISCHPSMLVRAVGGSKPAPPRSSRRTSRMRHLTTPRCRRALEVACGSCLHSRSARACLRSRCAWRAGRARWAWRWMPHCAGATMAPQDRRHRSRSDKPVRGGSPPPQRRRSSDMRAAATASPPRSASIASGPRLSSKKKNRRTPFTAALAATTILIRSSRHRLASISCVCWGIKLPLM